MDIDPFPDSLFIFLCDPFRDPDPLFIIRSFSYLDLIADQ